MCNKLNSSHLIVRYIVYHCHIYCLSLKKKISNFLKYINIHQKCKDLNGGFIFLVILGSSSTSKIDMNQNII